MIPGCGKERQQTGTMKTLLGVLFLFHAAFTVNATCDNSTEVTCVSDGECVLRLWRCDGFDDCEDGTDEEGCTSGCNVDGEFMCQGDSSCIPVVWRCDGGLDCADGSDEANCTGNPCSDSNEFMCGDRSCIPRLWVCDDEVECSDGSDESEVTCSNPVSCESSQFRCGPDNRCIPQNWRCDGDSDCSDGSDEAVCPLEQCASDQFQCSSGLQCIPNSSMCDGEDDCADSSDEDPALCGEMTEPITTGAPRSEPPTCTSGQRSCNDGTCIPLIWWCDFKEDCSDGEDEMDCRASLSPCSSLQRQCTNGECVNSNWWCDDDRDCRDGSDELNCSSESKRCDEDSFLCKESLQCIPERWICDDDVDCRDGSDEENCNRTSSACAYDPDYYHCPVTGRCFSAKWVCDGDIDCPDGSDEIDCPTTCADGLFNCEESGSELKCIALNWVCDGDYDCANSRDEQPSICNDTAESLCDARNHFACAENLQCVPVSWRCDSEKDCRDGSDEDNCEPVTCNPEQFHCVDEDRCIPERWACDGDNDCSNGTDEENCPGRTCPGNDFLCLETGKCLPLVWLCDGTDDCGDNSDEASSLCNGTEASTCSDSQFACRDSDRCIPLIWLCDSDGDCRDGSDEENCPTVTCSPDQFYCVNDNRCIPERWACDGDNDCLNGTDEENCPGRTCPGSDFLCLETGKCLPLAWLCDGTDDCGDNSDEASSVCNGTEASTCSDRQFACRDSERCIPLTWLCDSDGDCGDGSDEENCPLITCRPDQFQCVEDGRCIPQLWACDGENDCSNGTDEENCPPKSCRANEFSCLESGVCIPARWLCDGADDCGDNSDESSIVCDTVVSRCISDKEFACSDGRQCVHLYWRCDGDRDCRDGSDEENCEPSGCDSEQFHCAVENLCILSMWKCDGEDDCQDGADEENCQESTCRDEQFECDNKQCVPRLWLCDGTNDCGDNSDESMTVCNDTAAPSCSHREFTCADKGCIHLSWQCDEEADCTDGSDEEDCECEGGGFKCDDFTCVPPGSRCNVVVECPDGSDEWDCDQIVTCLAPDYFRCPVNKTCVEIGRLCDGVDDCQTGADESECTVQSCDDNNGGCGDRRCLDVPNGYYCECGTGYQFTMYGCSDVDECLQTPSPCPGINCTNLQPGYECTCPHPSYILTEDGRTCEFAYPTPPVIRLGQRNAVVSVDTILDTVGASYSFGNDRILSVAYDPVTGSTYVGLSSYGRYRIMRLAPSDGGLISELIIDNSGLPEGVAVDWIQRNLYWTDATNNTIKVASWDGRHTKTLIDEDLERVRGIAVDPRDGLMFWSDWGAPHPHIGRSSLDGSSRVTLVEDGLEWPNGVAVDYDFRRVYWVDSRLDQLDSVRYDGSDRRVLVRDLPHPYGLVVYQDSLYWSDWQEERLLSANKFSGENKRVILDNLDGVGPLALTAGYYNVSSRCKNTACSHLCLRSLVEEGFMCACPDNSSLGPDGRTCRCNNGSRLLEDGVSCGDENACQAPPVPCPGLACLEYKDGPRCQCPDGYSVPVGKAKNTCEIGTPNPPHIWIANVQQVLNVTVRPASLVAGVGNFVSAIALAYDGRSGSEAIYVSDNIAGTITRIGLQTPETSDVVVANVGAVFGLAFDASRDHLYWSDGRKGNISVMFVGGGGGAGYGKVLLSRARGEVTAPRALAVDSQTGFLYWTDISAADSYIARAALDGSSREVIVMGSLERPISLALDTDQGSIYWVDSGRKTIETAKVDGSQRRVLLRGMSKRPFGIAIYEDTVYWTDVAKTSLFSANKFSGEKIDVVIQNLVKPSGLVVAVEHKTMPAAPCDAATCSHFCLAVPPSVNPAGYVCSCPGEDTVLSGNSFCLCGNGTRLLEDGLTCEATDRCQRDDFQCDVGQCVPLWRACDGIDDCSDGSDERCDGACGDWGYLCGNGSCVPLWQRCDGILGDCYGDIDDELNCETAEDWCNATDPIPCPGVECVNLINRAMCVCPDGYRLEPDQRTCVFANPSFPLLLMTDSGSLLYIDTENYHIFDVHEDWRNPVGLAYDPLNDYIFITDSDKFSISRYSTLGNYTYYGIVTTDQTAVSIQGGPSEGIAYDSTHHNLYWVNLQSNNIEVLRFDVLYPSTVVVGRLGRPRALAVDPRERFIYWTDWGIIPAIGKAGLDGSNPRNLVSSDIVWPSGLTLDHQARRVYWLDSKLDTLEYIGFDGDDRRILLSNDPSLSHPFSIALYEDKVFWGDWATKKVTTANKFTGEILNDLQLEKQVYFMAVIPVRHDPYSEVVDSCAGNHSCSHYCLPSPVSSTNATCACPYHAHLSTDGRTCLCNNQGRLLEDGINCEDKREPGTVIPMLPLHVGGVTSQFLTEQGVGGTFRLECRITQSTLLCGPEGVEEGPANAEGRYKCMAP